MTLREAKDILRPYGIRIEKTGYGDEYRVSYAAHDLEESAYYADDIWDAIETGKVMAGAEEPPLGNPAGMTFRQLPIGATFRFSSERTFPHSGMARGPWKKTSARGYVHADDERGSMASTGARSRQHKYTVGSTSAEVDPESLSNPGELGELPYEEWIPAHAVRFNEDGTVSLMREDAAERIPNVSDGFVDKQGRFHPIRWADDYDRSELTNEDAEKKDYFGTPSAAYYKKHGRKAPKGTPRGGSSLLTKKKKRR